MDPVLFSRLQAWTRFLRQEDIRTSEKWKQYKHGNLIPMLPDDLVMENIWPKISYSFLALRWEDEEVYAKEKALFEIWNLRALNEKWRHLVDTTIEWNSFREVKGKSRAQQLGIDKSVTLQHISATCKSLASLVAFYRHGLQWVPHLTLEDLMEVVDFVDDMHVFMIIYKG